VVGSVWTRHAFRGECRDAFDAPPGRFSPPHRPRRSKI